jgi:hypothetical protein
MELMHVVMAYVQISMKTRIIVVHVMLLHVLVLVVLEYVVQKDNYVVMENALLLELISIVIAVRHVEKD